MFSTNAQDNSKLVELAFIVGLNLETIRNYRNSAKDSGKLKPECLLAFPNEKDLITAGIIDFIFPLGLEIVYSDDSPKFYSIVLTNEKGQRTYVYILKLLEKIDLDEVQENEHSVFNSHNPQISQISQNNPPLSAKRSKREIYVPLVICLWSYICNTDIFKKILHEVYRIISYNDKNQSNFSTIQNYRKSELLNYFLFLSNVIKPPNLSKLTLNLVHSCVDIPLPSFHEIPFGDSSIKILFDYLEVSIIIKLWTAILNEKRIIIMANQSYLLFAVCEALLKLVFPFKWLHTYVPVLPDSFLEYLENPTPFIYGVNTQSKDPQNYYKSIDFRSLKELFPTHVICNVDTSQLHFDDNITLLPFNEETILRKKLQFVRNPYFFDVEEIVNNPKCKTQMVDVNHQRSFVQNVQYIFFRIIRNSLDDFDRKYVSNNQFDSVLFLNDREDHHTSLKQFWEKLITTSAFEYFVTNNKYEEESYTQIFKNISNSEKKNENDTDYFYNVYNYSVSMSPSHMVNFFKEMNEAKFEREDINNEKFQKYLSDYLKISNTVYKKSDKKCYPVYEEKFNESTNESFYKGNSSFYNWEDQETLPFNFYTNKQDEGFFRYVAGFYDYLTTCGVLKDLTELGVQREIISFLKIDMKTLFPSKITKNPEKEINLNIRKQGSLENVEELQEDNESFSDSRRTTMNNLINSSNQNLNISENDNNSQNLTSNNNINGLTSPTTNAQITGSSEQNFFSLEKSMSTFQYNLLMAFYFEEFLIKENLLKKNDILNKIVDFYFQAYQLNSNEFPRIRFYQLLKKFFDIKLLKNLKTRLKNNQEFSEFFKIIDFMIDKAPKGKEKYKNLKIETTDSKSESTQNQSNSVTPRDRTNTNNSDGSRTSKTSNGPLNYSLNVKEPLTAKYKPRCSENNDMQYLLTMKSRVRDDIEEVKKKKNRNNHSIKKIYISSSVSCLSKTSTTGKMPSTNPFSISEEIENFEPSEDTISSSKIEPCRMSLKKLLFGKCNASKIIDDMELANRKTQIKTQIINDFVKVTKIENDPLKVAENICNLIYTTVHCYDLNKYSCNMLTRRVLNKISTSDKFETIKMNTCELQKVNLTNFKNSKERICFWLNIFNFLTLFTIILKNEILNEQYDWFKFLKNSYFDIGGYQFSLYEIKNFILTKNKISKKMFEEEVVLTKYDTRRNFMVDEDNYLLFFGLTIPTKFEKTLRIYYPEKLFDILKKNAKEYCSMNLCVNSHNIVSISEYLLWLDENFLENYKNYKEIINAKVFECLSKGNVRLVEKIKYFWQCSFEVIPSWENLNY